MQLSCTIAQSDEVSVNKRKCYSSENKTNVFFFSSKGQYRKSGYFGVGIIWRFSVEMGWLNFGALYRGYVLFWR